jgi:transcription elongation factor Elf1
MSSSVFSRPAPTWLAIFAMCPRCHNKNEVDASNASSGDVRSHNCTLCQWPFQYQIRVLPDNPPIQ